MSKKKGNRDKNNLPSGPKGILFGACIVVVCMLMLYKLTSLSQKIQPINYSAFLKNVESGKVKKIIISGLDVAGEMRDGSTFETVIGDTPANWDLYKKNDVEVIVENQMNQLGFFHLLPLLLLIGTMMLVWYFFRQARGGSGGGGAGNLFSMGKSKAKMFLPSTIKETFDSVAGAGEAKEELRDVVDFLRNPEKYKRLGAKMTRGVLLVGEPGNGKTLLARAVAGEAHCPFFSISGSDFIEVFVGVGASRVRDLFAQARSHAPSIIFIDEIDAVGRHRGSGLGGGNDEREQTLNQLLTEMDGFQTSGGSVIVLAATNRPDVLDKALLRPGRFDKRVEVPYPDLKSREEILKLHAKSVKIDPEVDLEKIARGTPGFSGADLANIVNEAAINASKTDQTTIKISDFEEARDKILLGKEIKSMVQTPEELELTAYHEAGHTLIRLLLPQHSDPLYKVTIIPRGRALGVTHALPEKEKYTQTREELLASIASAMGGRAAEELVFNTYTTGAYSDFRAATEIARRMVCVYGMSDKVGVGVYTQSGQGGFEHSQKLADLIDQEVQDILRMEYQRALDLLRSQRDKLDLLAKTLLNKETLYAGEIYALLDIEPREEHKFS